jgi:GntR family transcriptional regulator
MNNEPALPLYKKLAEDIKNQISEGVLKENDKLPTELEFSKKYSVSRITVRKAMELLADDGYITKHQGIGTFVAAKKLNRINDKSMGFTDVCESEGKVASAELISLEWTTASVAISQHLCIEEGARVLRISRIRKCDGIPVMIEDNYFSSKYSYLTEQDLSKSIYAILRNNGDIPQHGTKTVEVGYATANEAELLNVREGSVLLLLRGKATNAAGEVIHYCKQSVNPDRYKLTIIT